LETTGWRQKDDRTIAEMRGYMEREKLDVFLPSKPAHIAYLMDYWDVLHTAILWEEMTAMLAVPASGEAFVVGERGHLTGPEGADVHPWWVGELIDGDRPGGRQIERMVQALRDKGLAGGRIGIERKWMPLAVYEQLRSGLPDAEFVSADLLVPQMGFIKTPREQGLMRKAAEVGIRAMEAYMGALRGGASRREAEIARAQRALECGGEWEGGPYRPAWTGGIDHTPAWWDVAARERFLSARSRNWLELPDESPFLVTHFEARFQFYYCDMAWHELYGPEPDDEAVFSWGPRQATWAEARHDFEVLRRMQTEALNQVRPGMDHVSAKKALDDYLASDKELSAHFEDYYIHGVGLEIHEEPVLCGHVPVPTPLDGPIYFQPGAVVSSEWFSPLWTVEEPFVLTESGWAPLVELKGLCDPFAP